MKTAFAACVLSCSATYGFAANTIDLTGGTSATVEANVKTQVNCAVSAPKADKPTCRCDENDWLIITYPNGQQSIKSVNRCFYQAFGKEGEYFPFCSGK
jgi:hypothetical protein